MHGVQGLQHTRTNVLGLSWGGTLFLCNLSNITVVVFQDNRGRLIGFGLLLNFVNDGSEKGFDIILETLQEGMFRVDTPREIPLDDDSSTCRVAERTTVINNTVRQELEPNLHCQPCCWI